VAAWEPFVAAAFAPVAVWVLWRAQTASVELLRWRLAKLALSRRLRWLYAIVSFLGVFLHEVSHAAVLLLSGHGVREFRAGKEQGHVLPARMRRGPLAFLSFLVAALAPLFLPPLLVLAGLWLLVDRGVLSFVAVGPGLGAAVDAIRHALVAVPQRILLDLARLDLARWPHAVLLALALVAMPSSRPSHVRSRFHGSEGDVAVLRAELRRHPLVFAAFLALLYVAYWLVLVVPAAYWDPFEALWAVALTGVALAILGAVWWSLVGLARDTQWWAWWLGPVAFAAGEVLLRQVPAFASDLAGLNALALAAWAAVGLAARLVAPRGGLRVQHPSA